VIRMFRPTGATLAFLALAAGAPAPAPEHAPAGQFVRANAAVAADISDLINAERSRKGRAPLRRSPVLDAAAAAHAGDMAANGYFSHTAPDGSTPLMRVGRAGYSACLIAENIASGESTAEGVVAAWMTSRPHRKNLLLRGASEFGFARAPGNVWVLLLARPGC